MEAWHIQLISLIVVQIATHVDNGFMKHRIYNRTRLIAAARGQELRIGAELIGWPPGLVMHLYPLQAAGVCMRSHHDKVEQLVSLASWIMRLIIGSDW